MSRRFFFKLALLGLAAVAARPWLPPSHFQVFLPVVAGRPAGWQIGIVGQSELGLTARLGD